MSRIAYRKLLYNISRILTGKHDIEELRYMCREMISRGNENSINNARELFDELEDHNYLGIDNLNELKEILKELGEEGCVSDVIQFEIRREEHREPQARIFPLMKTTARKVLRDLEEELISEEAIKMHCNFRTAAGALTTITCAMILRRSNTLQEFIGAFNNAVLPTATTLLKIGKGSICFTVQAENLSALKELWDMYQDGTLKRRLQEFLVSEEIKQHCDGEEVEVTVDIKEEEYKKACMDLEILQAEGATSLVRASVGVVNLKPYFMVAGVKAVVGAAIYRFCESSPTFFDDFALGVLVSGITLIDVRRNSVCFTVQAENLSALKALWDMYQDGTLQKRLQEFLVTEEIKKLVDGKEVEVTVSIDEQEYKDACLDLKIAEMEASRNKELPFTARRRNSDSSVSLKDMEADAMRIKLNQSQKKLKLERERTRALEEEIENPCVKLMATRSVGIQTTEPTKEATVGAQNRKEEEEATRIELREAQKELDLERKRPRDLQETIENLFKKLRRGPTIDDTAEVKQWTEEKEAMTIKLREARKELHLTRKRTRYLEETILRLKEKLWLRAMKEVIFGAQSWKKEEEATRTELREEPMELDLEHKEASSR